MALTVLHGKKAKGRRKKEKGGRKRSHEQKDEEKEGDQGEGSAKRMNEETHLDTPPSTPLGPSTTTEPTLNLEAETTTASGAAKSGNLSGTPHPTNTLPDPVNPESLSTPGIGTDLPPNPNFLEDG